MSRQYNFIWLLRKIKSLVVSRGCIDYRSQKLELKTKRAFGVKKYNSIAFSLRCLMGNGNKKKKKYPACDFLCYTFFCTP